VRRVTFIGRPRPYASTAPRPRGCWRSPVLRATARLRAGSARLSSIRANRRTRQLLRTPLAVWIGIWRETGFVWPTDSCCAPMSPRAAAGARRLWPRRPAAECGRTSEQPTRTDASFQQDPRAASHDLEQLECHAEVAEMSWCDRPVLDSLHFPAFSPYFSTLNFALFYFPGGRHA
jgi:hypothetical protein